jgi:glycosyltransferase involved in cell wall biosynthesis
MTQLSIIVPVYNVEKYIRPCIESIFNQGLDKACFEMIIVNDGSEDRSMEMITDIINQHTNITVINQENQGLSMARNNALAQATGEYILFVDSDDLLIDNCIPYLLDNALSSKADLIVADFSKMTNEQIAQFPNKTFIQKNGSIQEKTGNELLLQDLNPYYCHVWRTMYRRDFLNKNNLRFIPHIYYEDVPFTHQCYLKAKKCLRVHWVFIIYRKHHTSITSSFSLKKAKDYCTAISETWKMSNEENIDNQIKRKLRDDTFIHLSMLFYSLTSCSSISREEKMSILYILKDTIPDMTFEHGLKQRIVNYLYQRKPSVYMTLRIFYADYLQTIFWKIGDTIRNKKD